jgi:hypothetical protein
MSDLNEIKNKPEAVQLYNSMINYMNSDSFNPSEMIDELILRETMQ